MNRRIDGLEHSLRDVEGNIQTLSNQLAESGSRISLIDNRHRETEEKLKIDEQTVRELSARVSLLPTSEDFASLRRELNEKVNLSLFALAFCWTLLSLWIFLRFSSRKDPNRFATIVQNSRRNVDTNST